MEIRAYLTNPINLLTLPFRSFTPPTCRAAARSSRYVPRRRDFGLTKLTPLRDADIDSSNALTTNPSLSGARPSTTPGVLQRLSPRSSERSSSRFTDTA